MEVMGVSIVITIEAWGSPTTITYMCIRSLWTKQYV